MGQNSIEKMLEISTKIEKMGVSPQKGSTNMHRVSTKQDLDQLIENYDRNFYAADTEPTSKEDGSHEYNARLEMERLKEIAKQGGRGPVNVNGKNMPKEILESIINNPLDLTPIDPRMDELEEKIKNKMSGIKTATDILERVGKQSKATKPIVNEDKQPSSIDYDTIKTIVENVLDSRLERVKETINESNSHQDAYVPSMKYLSFKDKFYFVDNDDNVFECVMKYKGKRKK